MFPRIMGIELVLEIMMQRYSLDRATLSPFLFKRDPQLFLSELFVQIVLTWLVVNSKRLAFPT